VEKRGPLPPQEAVQWLLQVLDAVQYLHSQNPPIIHRDIKPANIKLSPDGRAYLVDFGIAKVLRAGNRTQAGARAVTPGYSPPEQYGTAPTDQRSDIYALGATLYFAVTGRVPPRSH
jgi:serine/threonine-protein kinase